MPAGCNSRCGGLASPHRPASDPTRPSHGRLAALDGDYVTGVQLESIISGKDEAECDDNSGAMRIKRLRDNLGGQIIATKLIRHVPSKGYQINSPKGSIRIG